MIGLYYDFFDLGGQFPSISLQQILPVRRNIPMKKLLSLLLAAGMLASVCIPTVYAVEPSAPLYSAEEMPDEIPSAGPAAPLTTSDQLMEQLSFEVTPDGGTPFNSTAPFQEMTMVVGRSYTFQVKLSEKPLSDLDYTLKDVRFAGTAYDPCYLTASNLNENAGTFVTTATGAASGFLGNMQLTFMQDDSADTAVTLTIGCFGTVVTDSGNLLFCNESGAEISTLDVDAAHKEFTLSIGGFTLNESTMEIDYATTAPDSVSWDEEDQEFGTVRLTVSQAVLTGSTFTATIKDKNTQEVLATAVLTLRWINEVSSGTLPDGSTVCFGIKGPDSYQPYSASQYTQTAGLSSPDSVQIFFGKSEGDTIRYTDQPEGNSLASIQVISLSPEVVTIDSQTQPTDDTPFTCTFHVNLENCTTAQLQATVTLQDGTTATSLFTINIVEAVSAKEVTVRNTAELTDALANTALPYGSTIYLDPGTYTGDFVVSRPVNLIASQYNGTLPLYDKDGAVMPDSNAVVIDGTITANVPNVEVFGLRFENKGTAANRTALTDATLVTGCTFTGYDTAVALSTNSSAIGTNYRILKNAFVGNTTALRFEKSEWKSMIQDNSFLNNDTAIELASGCFVDGAASSNVYGKNVNGGKWNNNFFRGADNQKALNDERSEGATLLLNYNYYKYGTVAGAQDRLFTSQACDHSVFYTTPELTAVSTEVSLTELTKQGGLDLVAQQQDTTKNDNALNVSSDLFDKLKNDTDAENLPSTYGLPMSSSPPYGISQRKI